MSYDSMEYRKYTGKGELDKAIHTLEGILKGIAIDKKINADEIMELKNWCSLNMVFINTQPFNEIIPLVEKSIEDELLDPEEQSNILWVCENFKSDSIYYDVISSDIQKLQGILHGIMADNIISDDEINELKIWLEGNDQLQGTYPYDEIFSLLVTILKDGKIDDIERDTLKVFFSDFVDIKSSYNLNVNEINELRNSIQINGICSVDPNIEICGKTFCFTGASSRTKRDDIRVIIESLSGSYIDNVSKAIDYLVIGDNGNPCWAFSCYGRKVEKAMDLRKKGHKIIVVHENDFWNIVPA